MTDEMEDFSIDMSDTKSFLEHLYVPEDDKGEALRAFLVNKWCDTYGRFPTKNEYSTHVGPAAEYILENAGLRVAK